MTEHPPTLPSTETPLATTETPAQRCGLVAIVGKPNVGKSTLLNALVGQKISITSRKAQTTRHRITGIVTRGQTQFVFADTPGFQTKHSAALNKSLNKTVAGTLNDVDVVIAVVEAGSIRGPDELVWDLLKNAHRQETKPTLLIANKLDTVRDKEGFPAWLQATHARGAQEGLFCAVFPMSAKSPKDVQRLLDLIEQHLPEQSWFYAPEELTDRSERFLASEMIREKLFRLCGDELPYTSTVVIDEFKDEPPAKAKQKTLKRISATIIVERDSHKGMVVGAGGAQLKRIGSQARVELEKLYDAKVFLQLWVKVKSGWADDAARLKTYGYE